MKRARIGTTDIDTSMTIWTDGHDWLRFNAMIQYAVINECNAEYNLFYDSDTERAEQLLNRMDVAYTTVKCIEAYGGQAELLERAGIVLGQMIEAGEYAKSYASMDARNTALNSKIAALQHEVENWQNWQFTSPEWAAQWRKDVLDMDYYSNPATGERLTDEPGNFAAVGFNGTTTAEYSRRIADCSTHWLYYAVDDERALDQFDRGIPKAVRRKQILQLSQAQWMFDTGTVPVEVVYSSARAGIATEYGLTAEQAVYGLQVGNGNVSKALAEEQSKAGVGDPLTAAELIKILGLVVLILKALSKVLDSVSGIIRSVSDAEGLTKAPTEAELAAAQAEQTDYLNYMRQLDNPIENLGAEIIDFVRKPIVWIVAGGVLLLRSTKK